MAMTLENVTDWQVIDIILDKDEPLQVVWVENEPIELGIFVRYGTPWIGDAPDCVDKDGNLVPIEGVSADIYRPYYIETNDDTQEVGLWQKQQ